MIMYNGSLQDLQCLCVAVLGLKHLQAGHTHPLMLQGCRAQDLKGEVLDLLPLEGDWALQDAHGLLEEERRRERGFITGKFDCIIVCISK